MVAGALPSFVWGLVGAFGLLLPLQTEGHLAAKWSSVKAAGFGGKAGRCPRETRQASLFPF